MPTAMTCEPIRLIRKFAGTASDALLDPACKQFYQEPIEGFIGYKQLAHCAIVLGDPVSAPSDAISLAQAFSQFAHDQHLSIVYMMTTASFTQAALNSGLSKASLCFGEELWIPLDKNPFELTGEKASLLRRKVRHSQQEEVTVQEYTGQNPELERQMIALGNEWLSSREGLQIHTSKVRIFENRFGKRWFYAMKNNQVIGVLILNRMEATQSYLLNRYMVSPKAPGGTPEALVMKAIDTLREEKCPALCAGIVISKKAYQSQGLSSWQDLFAKMSLTLADRYFGLANRKVFWEKFNPLTKPSNLLFESGKIGLNELKAMSKALHIID